MEESYGKASELEKLDVRRLVCEGATFRVEVTAWLVLRRMWLGRSDGGSLKGRFVGSSFEIFL